MGRTVLITGGAGFIGSHLADRMLDAGWTVRALDILDPQVHGSGGGRPDYLDSEVELQVGDVRDGAAVRRALRGVDAVVHLAAAVGVGQSMYQVERYVDVNVRGTAVLLEAIAERPVGRLVVASSMSVYGEGLYRDADGRLLAPPERPHEQVRRGRWEPVDAAGRQLTPAGTSEDKTPLPTSVYALSKYDQERLCLILGEAYGVPAVALRFFNVYGPRQALSNPYTGVLAIFASRLLNDRPPLVFEDGHQRRDFVHVRDVAEACRLSLESSVAGRVFNVGSGRNASILEIALRMAAVLGKSDIEPRVTGEFRVGDIRHCFADISRIREEIRFEPKVSFESGLSDLAGWLEGQVALDRVEDARAELGARGLAV